MKTHVTHLWDVKLIPMPEDVPEWRVSDAETDALISALAAQHAAQLDVPAACVGDTVFCAAGQNLADRTVMIYPGRNMPGAEAAEEALVGAKVGETVKTELCGSPATLTVQRVVRLQPATIDDALITGEGIDGVATVDAYRRYIREKTEQENRSFSARSLSAAFRQQLIERSEYAVDEEEREAWLETSARELFDMYLQEGIDPHIPEDGTEFLTDEQAIEQFKEKLRPQYLARAMNRAFCLSHGITMGPKEAEIYSGSDLSPDMAEDTFYESKTWDLLYEIAMERLEGEE